MPETAYSPGSSDCEAGIAVSVVGLGLALAGFEWKMFHGSG